MGRRTTGHSFMPGKWVFPGGRIARQDFGAPAASELRPDVAAILHPELGERRTRALAMAAVRETFEETGLLLAASWNRLYPPSWHTFCTRGVAADLAALSLIARLITPPHREKRFDTRFFMANADRLLDRSPVDSRELEELRWFTLGEIADFDLALPTRMILGDLGRRFAGEVRPILFRRFRSARG
jgi:8-oxo-dGTP pyrophosphatase MutT (NUDIX family)